MKEGEEKKMNTFAEKKENIQHELIESLSLKYKKLFLFLEK